MIELWQRASHLEQRELVREAWAIEFGEPGKDGQIALVQAVTGLETRYGCPDNPPVWLGSGNQGAYQHKCPPCSSTRHNGEPWGNILEHGCFSSIDTKPKDDGTSTPYAVCFRRYACHLDGIRDLVRWIKARPDVLRATMGTPAGFSEAMYRAHYFEGYGATVTERIAHHALAVQNQLAAQQRAFAGDPDYYPQCRVELVALQWPELLELAREDMTAERDREVTGNG